MNLNKKKRKLRLCLLLDLENSALNPEQLLEKIAEVYADFNCPPDMEEFIYYMPAKNYDLLTKLSVTECRQQLLTIFNNFLNKEKNDLKKNT